MIKKVFVFCPGAVVTGGPELLHQLVHVLSGYGIDAKITYYPLCENFSVPENYAHYGVSQGRPENTPDELIVLPETATGMSKEYLAANIAIWWLSVDNFFSRAGDNKLTDLIRDTIALLRGRRLPIFKMKNFLHFSQSEYASLFLSQHGLNSVKLTDYLGKQHLAQYKEPTPREDIVLFNPKKGKKITSSIISLNKDIKFVPLIGMAPDEVRSILSKAKVYIDFGNHPGKDRFPREAAMAGCCVITGMRGSAANSVDLPIPNKYKISESDPLFFGKVRSCIDNIFIDYEGCVKDFSEYRVGICDEPRLFSEQVASLFLDMVELKK